MTGPPSLLNIAQSALIRYKDFLGDLGHVPFELLETVLAACTAQQLSYIEDETLEGSGRVIAHLTWPLWFQLVIDTFGPVQHGLQLPTLPASEEEPAAPPAEGVQVAHYRKVFEQRLLERAKKRELCGKRLRQLWEQEAYHKKEKQIQVINPLSHKRRRPAQNTAASLRKHGSTVQPGSSRKRLLKKLGLLGKLGAGAVVSRPTSVKQSQENGSTTSRPVVRSACSSRSDTCFSFCRKPSEQYSGFHTQPGLKPAGDLQLSLKGEDGFVNLPKAHQQSPAKQQPPLLSRQHVVAHQYENLHAHQYLQATRRLSSVEQQSLAGVTAAKRPKTAAPSMAHQQVPSHADQTAELLDEPMWISQSFSLENCQQDHHQSLPPPRRERQQVVINNQQGSSHVEQHSQQRSQQQTSPPRTEIELIVLDEPTWLPSPCLPKVKTQSTEKVALECREQACLKDEPTWVSGQHVIHKHSVFTSLPIITKANNHLESCKMWSGRKKGSCALSLYQERKTASVMEQQNIKAKKPRLVLPPRHARTVSQLKKRRVAEK